MKDTKEKIITESSKLFAKHGFAGTTVAELGAASGIAASSLFSHFKSKEEIYEKVVDRYIANLQSFRKKFKGYENMTLREFITFYIQKVSYYMESIEETIQGGSKTQAQYFFFTLESSMKKENAKNVLLAFEKEEMVMWKQIIDHAIEKGEINKNLNSQDIAELFRYSYLGMAYVYSINKGLAIKQLKQMYSNIYEMIKA